MPRAFAVSLALLLAFSAGGASRDARAADSDRDWLKLETPRFVLYSNARERDAKRLLRELETFQHVVSRFLGLTNAQRRPALVYYFEDDASFVPYKPLYQGKPRQVGGFHADDPLDHVLALSRQNRSAVTMRVLFHEYTHLLTARQFRRAPLWAHEGVAEVFSTFESDGDQFDIGVALTNHVFYLQKNRPAAVEGLLRVDYDSREYNEGNRAGSFYATSWLLAHYLLFAQRGFESDVMARYADVSARMTNRVEAFEAAFGMSPKAADAELRKYVKGGRYTLVRQTYPELEAQRPRRVDLGPGEVDYALGRLLQMVQQFGPARERLEKAADPLQRIRVRARAWRCSHGARRRPRNGGAWWTRRSASARGRRSFTTSRRRRGTKARASCHPPREARRCRKAGGFARPRWPWTHGWRRRITSWGFSFWRRIRARRRWRRCTSSRRFNAIRSTTPPR
jgi:hypothetical protein